MTTEQNNTAARKPHAVETCEDHFLRADDVRFEVEAVHGPFRILEHEEPEVLELLTLKEIDAISGGVVRRRRLQAARRPNLASGPFPFPWAPASIPTPCPTQPIRGPYPCPLQPGRG